MKQRNILHSVMTILFLGLASFVTPGFALNVSGTQGTITELDVQSRMITISNQKFVLSDPVQVLTSDNTLISQVGLKEGQSIEYWLTPNKETHSDVVSKIRILSKYSDGGFKR